MSYDVSTGIDIRCLHGDAAHRRAGKRIYPAMKRKESDILAATMVIRMLWFKMKEAFLWEDTDEKVLSVAKMTEEIENIGVNNHGLLKFG
ncbi:uncharacterized protein FFB20_11017 [Fusarium fujikuroi]|nr:uncharacterized protein FFB20_11017 [Fusarium fujikuroi]SCO24260.1 uncharacterized protein FFE2_15902 [Fusarium fujikuroi]SCO25591.1 uncharacterized protein FFC1_15608 [Fusarium fujikuroi]SCO54408.1 uncharacterized protein FFNC_15497 [Fusarium fujikuroi]SCV61295.1 uncharacterized protein FFFS_15864 [Fusarium fujikuroi]